MLSDAYVHFTPEFYSLLNWEVRVHADEPGGEIFLNYFQSRIHEIERQFLFLLAVHGKILQAFDRCFDGYRYREPLFKSAVDALWRAAKSLNEDYAHRYGVTFPELDAHAS